MAVLIKPCSCKHEYQDQTYGKNMRVHNQAKGKNPGEVTWRCTVCKSEK